MKENSFIIIKSILLIFILLFTTGCDNKELEAEKKKQSLLQSNFNRLSTRYANLQSSYYNIENKLNLQKENNKGLEVNLAKGEVHFMQKYREELKKDEKELVEDRELMKKEISKNFQDKYITYFISLIIISIFISILWYNSRRKIINKSIDLIKENKNLTDQFETLKEEHEKFSKTIYELDREIKNFEEKEKDSTRNSVVNKIDEYQNKRDKRLQNIQDNVA